MATRAKYTRVRQEDKKEEKPDTDILMKFSPTYGTCLLIKVAMLAEPLPSSLGKVNHSSQSRLPIGSWTELYGLLRLSKDELLGFTRLLKSKKEKLLMFMNPEKKDSSELNKRDS